MKKKFIAFIPLIALLTSCPIVNPVYPQDLLDLSKYQDPISLDWTNDDESEAENALYDDEEELRTYLNNSRAVIKKVDSFINVYRGKETLRIGRGLGERAGELVFTLKNIFKADALALHLYPYNYDSYSYVHGKMETIYDAFDVSVNEREYISLEKNETSAEHILTFSFEQAIEQISIQTKSGRGYLFALDIYQIS